MVNPQHRVWDVSFFSLLCLFVFGCLSPVFAQTEPPLNPPTLRSLELPEDGVPLYGWVLYPTLDVSSVYDSNLYQSPVNPIGAAGLYINPALVAEHTNGIHTTRFYGNVQSKIYPWSGENDTFDRQGGVIQRYEAMRDLIFTFQGDYTHRMIATLFQNAIPGPITGPGNPPPLPSAGVQALGTIIKNPNDQFTGSASVQKIFNRAFVQFGASFSRTNYDDQTITPDYNVVTYTGSGAVWLFPAAFAYADASYADYSTAQRAYVVRLGLGSAQIGLFRGSIYVGHQGTEVPSGTAGGLIFGGKVTYLTTHRLTLSLSVDEIFNDSNQAATTLAVNPASILTAISVPTSASTRTTATALKADYIVTGLITAYGVFGYTRVEYLDTVERDDSWLFSAGIRYSIRPNLALTTDYIHSQIVSNVPDISSTRDYIGVGAHYQFRPM